MKEDFMLEKSLVFQKAYTLSIEIIGFYKSYANRKNSDLVRQLLKSGTSIGANISEGMEGISKDEFSAKLSIAYKEANETRYWISLLKDSGYMNVETAETLELKIEEICKMLFSILKSTGRIRNA